jgi:subtilisin family serine protease
MDWKIYRRHNPPQISGQFPHGADTPTFEFLAAQGPGRRFNYVPGKILVNAAHEDMVRDLLSAEGFDFEADHYATRLYSGPSMEHGQLVEVIDRVRRQAANGGAEPQVSPLHAFAMQDHGDFGPAGPPDFAAPLLVPSRGTVSEGEVFAGTGVNVGILDSGAKLDHPLLAGYLDDDSDDEVIAFDETGHLKVSVGHGTHVAGIVRRCAPGARIYARRVLDGEGVTDDLKAAKALRELGGKVDILCLPWGGFTMNDRGPQSVQTALDTLFAGNPDLIVTAAAGNDSRSEPFFPAADDRVIGVGALDENGERAGFSNYGTWVDTYALGTNIHSAFVEWQTGTPSTPAPGSPPAAQLDGRSAQERQALIDEQECNVANNLGPWATWSGTSFATPMVAGSIAAAMRPQDGSLVSARQAAFQVVRDGRLPRPTEPGSRVTHRYFI